MRHTLFALVLSIVGARLNLPIAEVEKRFEASCVDGRWQAECPALREELELQLLSELRAFEAARAPLDREVLRVAARGSFPLLADFALRKLTRIEQPADRETAIAALDHPSPGVRRLANFMLENADPAWRTKLGRWWRINPQSDDELVPDLVPDLELLGVPPVQGLRYRFFASDQRRGVFTTATPPEQLLNAVAKGGKVFTGDQLAKAPPQIDASSIESIQKEMQAALARGDLNALQAIAERATKIGEAAMKTAELSAIGVVAEFSGDLQRIRYVQVPTKRPGAIPVTIAIGRDDAFGQTVMVISY